MNPERNIEWSFELAEKRVISDTDPYYVKNRMDLKRSVGAYSPAFGEYMLRDGKLTVASSTVRDEIFKILGPNGYSLSLEEVLKLFVNGLTSTYVRSHPIVLEAIGQVSEPWAQAERIFHSYIEKDFPEDLIESILRAHVTRFQEARAERSLEIPEMRKRFESALSGLIDNKRHPLSRDMLPKDLIQRRLSEVGVIIVDKLDIADRSGSDLIGEFNPEKNTASFVYDPESYTSQIYSHYLTYAHEMVHVLSGRTITRLQDGAFFHERVGLSRETGNSYREFEWLNEAVTESLAQDIYSGKRNYLGGAYLDERFIYKKLLKRIPEEIFLQAYFENCQRNDGERPYWDRLVEAADKAYGEDIFNIIDDKVLKDGVEEAGKSLKYINLPWK